MTLTSVDAISWDFYKKHYDVGFDEIGTAYCKETYTHQWKFQEQHFNERSVPKGYISICSRHMGCGVRYSIPILPGEDYIAFWTRIETEINSGYVQTGQYVQTWSNVDKDILESQGLEVEKLETEEEIIFPHGKEPIQETESSTWLAIPIIGAAAIALWVVLAK